MLSKIPYTYQKRGVFYFNRMVPIDPEEHYQWIFTMRVERRDAFIRKLTDRGIMVSRVHERNDKHTTVLRYAAGLPQLEELIGEMVCIPVGWWVTDADRAYIVDTIRAGW